MTYGKLALQNGWFVLKTDPHVRMKVLRLFPAMKDLGTALQLKATPANTEDLQWVLDRYPHEVPPPVRQWMRLTCLANADRRSQSRSILEGNGTLQGLGTAIPLRDYQLEAVELARVNPGIVIGDDVGLGKTGSALGIIADEGNAPALVVTKTHLQQQWVDEAKKFVPHLKCHILRQTAPYALPAHQITICSYPKLAAWADEYEWNTVVYDECQDLRGADTKKGDAAYALGEICKRRIGLSATPIFNFAGEAYNIWNRIHPGALGTRDEFNREWKCDDKGRLKDPVALGAWLRSQGLYVRRTREQVGRQLPPVETISHVIEHDPKVIARVLGSAGELAKKVLEGAFTERGIAARELNNQLRQITGLAKAPFVADFVRNLVENGERVILGGWHREVYEIWGKEFRKNGISYTLYTGSESTAQKQLNAAKFIGGEVQVLIMSLRSGEGLNGLQMASNTVVVGELDWSPKVLEQLVGRLRRDGQEKRVTVFYLIAEDGADPVMARVLSKKWASATAVTDPHLLNPDTKDTDFDQADESRIAELARAWLKRAS